MSRFTKTIYLLLFAALLLMPHFSRHVGAVPREYVESLAMLVMFAIAYLTYFLSQREMKAVKRRTLALETEVGISGKRVAEAFQYIGAVNRKLPLLKNVSSDLLSNGRFTRKYKKKIFQDLLATAAVSIAQALWGVFRFVEMERGRTMKECMVSNAGNAPSTKHIGNKRLLASLAQAGGIKTIDSFFVISTSDKTNALQTFLILPSGANRAKAEYVLLQAITDQAQLFYKYLFTERLTTQ